MLGHEDGHLDWNRLPKRKLKIKSCVGRYCIHIFYCWITYILQDDTRSIRYQVTLFIFHCQDWIQMRYIRECSGVKCQQAWILISTSCCLVSHSSIFCRSHLSAKDRVKTQKDVLPAVSPHTTKTSDAYHYLKHEACNSFPSPMMVQSKKLIWKVR